MRAVGFFFAVFFCMLVVFLVATGEVSRLFSRQQENGIDWEVRPGAGDEVGKNMLDFEFWDVKEGRRRFIIRAELNQEALQGSDPLAELKTISLRSGVIELPVDKDKKQPSDPAVLPKPELVLHFQTAIYSKGDGLTGKKPLQIRLYDGHGETSEGTRFFFEELLFSQEGKDKGRFRIHSDKPVRIVSESYLEVRGPGLGGLLTDSGGFERLEFPAPVHTFLDPGVFDVFALGEVPKAVAGDSEEAKDEIAKPKLSPKIAAVCRGPLLLEFRKPSLRPKPASKDDEADPGNTRITFQQDVVFYQVKAIPKQGESLPAADGNRFECQKLELEIRSVGGKPVPIYGLATWPNGRVRGYHVRGNDVFRLEGDQLEWFSRIEEGATSVAADFEKNPGEAVLSRTPSVIGKDVQFDAKRAVLRPKENTIRLEEVAGTFRRPEGAKDKADAGTSGRKWSHEESSEATEAGTPFETVKLAADEVDFVFSKQGSDHALSHFIARSTSDSRGVVILGEDEGDSKTPVRAEGYRLRYEEKLRRLTMTGTPQDRPRLSFGESWIESDRLILFRDEGHVWFEDAVKASFEKLSTLELTERSGGETEKLEQLPELFDLEAQFLEIRRDKGKLTAALARGSASDPVVLSVLPEGAKKPNKRFRFLAPEVHFNAKKRDVELFGSNDDGGRALARMEFKGGEVRAGKIRFEQKTHMCFLRESVDVRLFAAEGTDRIERLRLQSDKADVTFFEGFRTAKTEPSDGPLEELALVKKLHAVSDDGRRLLVSGRGFGMQGEQATWDAESRELRFFGRETQEITLDHEQIRGPVRAREIVFNAETNTATLTGSVIGKLSQPVRSRNDGSTRAEPVEPFVWDFETSSLDIALAEDTRDDAVKYRLDEVRASDKVVLRNEDNGVKLLGDDLLYDHDKRSIRVFSEEGRLQTLMRRRAKTGPVGDHDEILARDIFVFLYDDPSVVRPADSPKRLVVVQFEKEVKANFVVALPGRTKKGEGDQWKVEANSLVLHVDPEADPGSHQILPRAIATGSVVASSEQFRATGDRAEYSERDRELRVDGSPATATDFRLDATTTQPTVIVRKVGSLIQVEDPSVQRNRRK